MTTDQTHMWMATAGKTHRANATRKSLVDTAPKEQYARWEKPEVVESAFTKWEVAEEQAPERGGIALISDGKTAFVDTDGVHSLVIGSTGSMKTRRLIMPQLESLARVGESVVVADPKGELYTTMGNSFIQKGYNVQVINLRDPTTGCRWNPLEAVRELWNRNESSEARSLLLDIACAIIPIESSNDPYWEQSARSLLYGVAWHLIVYGPDDEPVTLANVYDAVESGDAYEFTGKECTSVRQIGELPPNTRHCVEGVFLTKVWNYICSDEMKTMMSTSDLDMSQIGMKKTAVFLIVPDEKTTFNTLVSLMVKQLYVFLIDAAAECKKGSLPVRVNFILDEFANFPRIEQMSSMITASRSRNIRFTLVVQTMKQLRAVYGNDADAIKDNCLNWIFLTGRDVEFMEEFSQLIGKDENGNPLMSVYAMSHLAVGEALILSHRLSPFIGHIADISEYGFDYGEAEVPARKDEEKSEKKAKKKPKDPILTLFEDD